MEKCYICGKSVKSISGNHHFETHGLSSNEYLTYLYHDKAKLDKLKSLYEKKNSIPKNRCLICNAEVNSVGAHVRVHGMKATEYRKLVLTDPDKLKYLQDEWKAKHGDEVIKSRGVLADRKAVTSQTCKICGKTMKRLGNHLHDEHGITKPEYDALTNEEVKNFVDRPSLKAFRSGNHVEVCKICGRSFDWLNTHLSQVHKISREEYDSLSYEDMLKLPNDYQERNTDFIKDKDKCPVCGKYFTYINKDHVLSHGYNNQQEFLKAYPGTNLYKRYHTGSDPVSYGAFRVLPTKNGKSRDGDNNLVVKSNSEYQVIKAIDNKLRIPFEYETLEIPYDDEITNSVRMYTPDIYIPEYNLIIEIKDDNFDDTKKIDDGSPLHDKNHYKKYDEKVAKVKSSGYQYLLVQPSTVNESLKHIKQLNH